MRLTCDTKGISRLVLILLMLFFFAVGALFSYVYTMGFYAPSEFKLPNESVITIESVEFSDQNTSFFNVTLLNPSYSPSSVEVTRIEARTPDDNEIHMITNTQPTLPYQLERGEIREFQAMWNWANYTGIKLPYTDQPIEIRVFLADRRGEILEVKRPLTTLVITDLVFNSSISVNHFNATVQNVGSSKTYVNITAVSIDGNIILRDAVTPSLPHSLNPGDAPVQFQCFYNWTDVQGREVTVRISTLQGYIAERTHTLPEPVTLETQVVFNDAVSTDHFNITVFNAANSSTYVDISRITVAVDGGTPFEVSPLTSYQSRLYKNASVLIMCAWNWGSFKGRSSTAEITVYTSQGFTVTKEDQIP